MKRRMLLLSGLASLAPCVRGQAPVLDGPALIVVVGGPAGTPGDLLSRTLSGPLAAELGQPVVVENRPGAAGTIALGAVARGRADGNLLGLMGLQSAVAPSLLKSMPYEMVRDLSPVRQLTTVSNVLVVRTDSSLRTLDDVIRAARLEPLTYASGGNATPAHLAAELFAQEGRAPLRHVPFNGAVAGVTALLGGHVQLMFATAPAIAPQVQAGTLRALATSAQDRLALLPQVPTLSELGWPGAAMRDWHGLVVPVGTPSERVRQLADATGKILAQAGIRDRLLGLGLEPVAGSGPEAFRDWIGAEVQRWGDLVQRAGISLQ
jgi:tripartite-type tricarboxylate transporter receptor subunit TctC